MLKHRVIPALLLQNGGMVKTRKFESPKYIGDPINAIRIFNEKEVDELMVLDITASSERREPDYRLIEEFAGECFMPLTYGGGIRTAKQAAQIFRLGVEKICLQTAALDNISLVRELADRFGSQSVVASVDIKRSWLGSTNVYASTRRDILRGVDWLDHVKALVAHGAGEVLLNSVNKDGTFDGPDLEIISAASRAIDVPLIALGGISSLADIKLAVSAGANAVAAGSFFVFHGPHRAVLITYPSYQELEDLFID